MPRVGGKTVDRLGLKDACIFRPDFLKNSETNFLNFSARRTQKLVLAWPPVALDVPFHLITSTDGAVSMPTDSRLTAALYFGHAKQTAAGQPSTKVGWRPAEWMRDVGIRSRQTLDNLVARGEIKKVKVGIWRSSLHRRPSS